MSVAMQQAVLDETLELSNMFRQNAALKHGIPDVRRVGAKLPNEQPIERTESTTVITKETAATEVADNDTLTPGAVAATAGSSLLRKAAPFLLGAAAVGGGASLPWAYSLINRPAPVADTPAPQDGSLLQYLQDHGQHLPGGDQWPTK